MSKKIKNETVPADLPAKSASPKAGRKATRAKAKPKMGGADGYDFVGKVESIVVRSGGDAEAFEFGLRGRHGSRQAFRLRTSDSFALAIMAPIVTAAHATAAKIGVRVAPAESGNPYVVEVASRPRLGKQS